MENLEVVQTQLATLQAAHDILEGEFEAIKAQAKASDLSYSSALTDYELGNVDAEFLADKKADYLADRQSFEEKLSELNAKKSAIATVSATVKELTLKNNAALAIAKIDLLIGYINNFNAASTYENMVTAVQAINTLDGEIYETTNSILAVEKKFPELWKTPVSLGNYSKNISIEDLMKISVVKGMIYNNYISNFRKDYMAAIKSRLNEFLN